MSKKVRAKVHVLTADKSHIGFLDNGKARALYYQKEPLKFREGWYPKHLYFTTDEEIKVGSYYFFEAYKGLAASAHRHLSLEIVYCKSFNVADNKFCFIHPNNEKRTETPTDSRGLYSKIIATTYSKLTHLPQPSQSFIKAYCEKGGIDEVDVEYIEYIMGVDGVNPKKPKYFYKLRTSENNTITIHHVKAPEKEEDYFEKEVTIGEVLYQLLQEGKISIGTFAEINLVKSDEEKADLLKKCLKDKNK